MNIPDELINTWLMAGVEIASDTADPHADTEGAFRARAHYAFAKLAAAWGAEQMRERAIEAVNAEERAKWNNNYHAFTEGGKLRTFDAAACVAAIRALELEP